MKIPSSIEYRWYLANFVVETSIECPSYEFLGKNWWEDHPISPALWQMGEFSEEILVKERKHFKEKIKNLEKFFMAMLLLTV
jgi:hypothetical protein